MDEPRLLTPADLEGVMRLKEAAGWNQTREDWINLMRLSPEGCFGIDVEGRLAATATAVCFGGRLAWIGMVLTDPALRGRGLARRLMERSIAWIESRGVEWIKLDATDMGKPLYEKLGFAGECAIERWGREAGREEAAEPMPEGPVSFALDEEAVGADRGEMLRLLAPLGCAVRGAGYGMGRQGSKASYFGPCVARSQDEARALLRRHIARHAGDAVYWDILPENEAAVGLACEFGFSPLRRLLRMARPGREGARPHRHDDSLVYAIAGFEFG